MRSLRDPIRSFDWQGAELRRSGTGAPFGSLRLPQPPAQNVDDAEGDLGMLGHQLAQFGVAHAQEQRRFRGGYRGHARLGIERGQFAEDFARPERGAGFFSVMHAHRHATRYLNSRKENLQRRS